MYNNRKRTFNLLVIICFAFLVTSTLAMYQIRSVKTVSSLYSRESHSLNNNHIVNSVENETLVVHTMEINVRNDDSLKIISTFVLSNNGSEPIEFFNFDINKNISSVFCYDPLGSLPFSWTIDPVVGNKINISMSYPLLQNEFYVFSVSYEIEDIIYQVDEPEEYFGLEFETKHVRRTNLFRLILNLPMYSYLLDDGIPAPLYPTPASLTSDDNFLSITWEESNIQLDDTDVFLVRYKIRSSAEIGTNINLLPLYIILAFIGGIAVSALAFFFLYRLKFKPVESGLVSSLLSDTEQEVIKAINDDSGISTQRRICDKTGYSKSKVSQILAKLEEKEVLKRERWGRTNKVTITNPSFKTIGQSVKTNGEDTS